MVREVCCLRTCAASVNELTEGAMEIVTMGKVVVPVRVENLRDVTDTVRMTRRRPKESWPSRWRMRSLTPGR